VWKRVWLLPVLLASSGYSWARALVLASSASRCVSSSGVTLPSLVAFSTACRATGISSACLLRASSSTSCFSSGSCSWSSSRGATRYKYSSSPSRRACVWFGVLSLSASLTRCIATVASRRRRVAARRARRPLGATSTPLDMPAYGLKSFAFTGTLCYEAFSVLPGMVAYYTCGFNWGKICNEGISMRAHASCYGQCV